MAETKTETACPIPACEYSANMAEFDAALSRPLDLKTTRSDQSEDAHRDMDGFDKDEELARLRRAVKETETVSPEENPELYRFIAEAFGNIDETLCRLGPLPKAWKPRETLGDASRIIDLPRDVAIEAIEGLIELVDNAVSCGSGFTVVKDDTSGSWVLEDRASRDWWLEGYSYEALSAIASRETNKKATKKKAAKKKTLKRKATKGKTQK